MTAPTLAARLAARERPKRRPAMFQHWDALAFLHWEMEPAAVQATLPPGLTVDTFEGRAYVGVVPFYMNKIRPRGLPCVPWLSHFLELNVRTHVHDSAGIPSVWFYMKCVKWKPLVLPDPLDWLNKTGAVFIATATTGA